MTFISDSKNIYHLNNSDFKGLYDFKNYLINLVKKHKFAGINLIGITPDGKLIAMGLNVPESMPDIKVGFKALYNELEKQTIDGSSYSNDGKDFKLEDDSKESRAQMAENLNKFLDSSPKSYPQLSDPEECAPFEPSHEDPVQQAEDIIKNQRKFR